MKTLRRLWRAFLARCFPFAFARWVNRQRCYIQISNDPSRRWEVKIGTVIPMVGKTLGRAMYWAFWKCEQTPDWQWTSDYLRTVDATNVMHMHMGEDKCK